MKSTLQSLLKNIFDLASLPMLLLSTMIARFVNNKKNRVFFGVSANNNLIYVRDYLRKLNYQASVIPWIIPNNEKQKIDYDLDIQSKFPNLYKNFFGQIILIYIFFIWTIFNFDVFIMPFQNRLLDRTGFLKWLEFQFLHLAGKKVILNPYGGDIQYVEVWENSDNIAFQELYNAWKSDVYYGQHANAKNVLKNTIYCGKYSDLVILSIDWPDYTTKFIKKEKIEYFHMRSFPRENQQKSCSKIKKNNIFKIVHATNHPQFKGTKFLEEAVCNINKNKILCELKILQGVSNATVLKEIQDADVVFDQILLGAYGRLAIEAMSLGKPVICYLREDFKKLYNNWQECPIINVNISNLQDSIIDLINSSEDEKNQIRLLSQAYVENYHSNGYVGEKLHTIIQRILKS